MEKWENIDIINENQLPAHAALKYEDALSLNGTWKFKCIRNPDKADPAFVSDNCDLSDFSDIEVPGCIEPQGFGAPYYYGSDFPAAINKSEKKIPQIDHKKTYCGLYKKTFLLDEVKDEQYILSFSSVKSAFYCFLNEEYVGMSKGSMLPCEFDVTDYLRKGENVLSVKVFQFSDATYIEDQDMWFLSGIYRDVRLIHRSKEHIEDVWLHSELINDYKNAIFHCDVITSAPGNIEVKIDGQSLETITADNKASLLIEMDDVRLWSAEKPELYDVEVIYKTENTTETKTLRFGFREDKVDHQKALYLHNGKPIKIRGVNYHAFTPDKGYYVPEEVYRKDLQLIKEANINAIRTSHYPQDDIFYDLCDELGIYVMDECNVESHGVRDKGVPGDSEKWRRHVLDRMERMVLRDRNHACVSIWSLGNESSCGQNHFRMKEKALSLDTSRPIHYEGGRNLELSDFLCDGYSSLTRERAFANKEDVKDNPSILQRLMPLLMSLKSITYEEYRNHPIIITEYQHAMGNSGSDVGEHVRIMDRCDQYCGGYVWDFKDKCLLKNGELTYGGDWGVKDQGNHFCANGITDAFSVPHSIYYEIQHGFQPIVIERTSDNKLKVYNRNFFTNTSEYDSYYELLKDGIQVEKGILKTDVGPRETKEYEIPSFDLSKDSDYHLNIFFTKDGSSAYQQFCLKKKDTKEITYDTWIAENENEIILNDKYVISKKTGDLTKILQDGNNILKGALRPSFFRAYTDGDAGFVGLAMRRHKKLDAFGKASISGLKDKIELLVEDGKLTATNENKLYTLKRSYAVTNDALEVCASVSFHKKAPNRFGMQMELDKSFDTMDYFGKGPEDHYADKDEGGLVGLYSLSIDEQDEYPRPQEHGNKNHVRFADLSNDEIVLHVEGEDLNVSFWPYTLRDLQKADHIKDLRGKDITTFNIDCIQNGMSDCFVRCDERYLIKPETNYSYTFTIKANAVNH